MVATVRFDFDEQVIIVTGGSPRESARPVPNCSPAAARGWCCGTSTRHAARRCATSRSTPVARPLHRLRRRPPADVEAALLETVRQTGRIDGLVNNAGIVRSAPFLQTSEADWRQVLDVNLGGAFRVAQAVARVMADAGRGAIVNMGSVSGLLASPDIGGLQRQQERHPSADPGDGAGAGAARDPRQAVAPGTIATDLAIKAVMGSEQCAPAGARRAPRSAASASRPRWPTVVAFLLSPAASYMTGSIVAIDGGRLALNYTVAADAADRSIVAARARLARGTRLTPVASIRRLADVRGLLSGPGHIGVPATADCRSAVGPKEIDMSSAAIDDTFDRHPLPALSRSPGRDRLAVHGVRLRAPRGLSPTTTAASPTPSWCSTAAC